MCSRRRWGSLSPTSSGCTKCTEMPFNGARIGTRTIPIPRPPQTIRAARILVRSVSFVEALGISGRSVLVQPSETRPSRTAGTVAQGSVLSGRNKSLLEDYRVQLLDTNDAGLRPKFDSEQNYDNPIQIPCAKVGHCAAPHCPSRPLYSISILIQDGGWVGGEADKQAECVKIF